jgi:cytochrome P450
VDFFQDPVGCLSRAYRRIGPVAVAGQVIPGLFRERRHALALGPEFNRQVFGDPVTFRTTGQVLRGPAGSAMRRVREGLTAMNGEKHRKQRQLILPLFAKKAFDGYCADMAAVAGSLIEHWPAGTTVDMAELLRQLALRSSARLLFGREDPARAESLGAMLRQLLKRNFDPVVWLWPVNCPGTPYRGLIKHAERLERELLDTVKRRRATPAQHADMLDILIRARDENDAMMTDQELIGQSAVLFGASYETQSNAMTWTVFLLVQHPEVMADLWDELDRTLGGAPPTIPDLDRLPLLDAVLKESMRLLPPVPFTIRSVTRPVEVGGAPLRNGDRVICSHYITHHLPDLYPEPERFLPERWSEIKPSQYEYLPFSAGPRFCVGRTLAMTMMKVSLAMIVQRWRFTILPGSRISRSVKVTMGPKYGLPMAIHKQDRRFESVRVRGNIHEMVDLPPASRRTHPRHGIPRPWVLRPDALESHRGCPFARTTRPESTGVDASVQPTKPGELSR